MKTESSRSLGACAPLLWLSFGALSVACASPGGPGGGPDPLGGAASGGTAPATSGSGGGGGSTGGAPSASGGSSGEVARCVGSATYDVVFDVQWTEANFPTDYPVEGPDVPVYDAAHMSPLVGGSHGALWAPYRIGEVASEGVEAMAESGDSTKLAAEVQAAVDDGLALAVIRGSGVGYPPGSTTAAVSVDEAHPLVTLSSMLAPSPDWFAGVSGVNLCGSDGFVAELVVDAVVYDAGTDNGVGYSYGYQDTQPPALIAALAEAPFSETNVVGTFRFVRK